MARAKKTSKKKRVAALKKVSPKQYRIAWDRNMEGARIEHKDGSKAPLAIGMGDVVDVYKSGTDIIVCSINYIEGYACAECFTKDGQCTICFAEPKDVQKKFKKKDIEDLKTEDIATWLIAEV